jgi:uncharacterized protein YbjT (DUF2867 family)
MILVAGSTGLLGSEICRLLGEKGRPFRAQVRETSDPAKVERVRSYGAEVFKGDLRDPASLRAACQGVETVICTVSSVPFSYVPGVNDFQTTDMQGVINLVDEAGAAGVKHMIYISFTIHEEIPYPLANAKQTVEQRLKDSGMIYTILKPSFFMEFWLTPAVEFDPANAKATVYGSGDQPIGFISYKDVAQFAVKSIDYPAARNCTLSLGGPENLSPHQVIQLFEKSTGRTFDVTHVPVEALQAQFDSTDDPMQKTFTGLMLSYAAGDPIDMRETQQSFAVSLTPVSMLSSG